MKQPNRVRMKNTIIDITKKMALKMNQALGEWYDIRVSATADHVADRINDRSNSALKALDTLSDMCNSLADHYSCYMMNEFTKKQRGEIVAYRIVDGQRLAIAFSTVVHPAELEGGKPVVAIRLRTFMHPYEKRLPEGAIHVNYKHPAIVFEYNGVRRELSRLTKMITSDDCPEALKVLR